MHFFLFMTVLVTVLVCQLATFEFVFRFQKQGFFLSVSPNANVLPCCKDLWERGEAVWNEICHIFFQIDATEPFGGYLNLVPVFILGGLLAVGAKSTNVSISLL